MSKFCSNCGKELNGKFCSNCGKNCEDNNVGLSAEANEYIAKKIESKKNHNGYRLTVGIIMIILGALIFAGTLSEDIVDKYEYIGYDVTLGFGLAAISAFIGGLLSIASRNNNQLLIFSAGCYISAAVCNYIGIKDVSLLFILCCIFAPINFVIYGNAEK